MGSTWLDDLCLIVLASNGTVSLSLPVCKVSLCYVSQSGPVPRVQVGVCVSISVVNSDCFGSASAPLLSLIMVHVRACVRMSLLFMTSCSGPSGLQCASSDSAVCMLCLDM